MILGRGHPPLDGVGGSPTRVDEIVTGAVRRAVPGGSGPVAVRPLLPVADDVVQMISVWGLCKASWCGQSERVPATERETVGDGDV